MFDWWKRMLSHEIPWCFWRFMEVPWAQDVCCRQPQPHPSHRSVDPTPHLCLRRMIFSTWTVQLLQRMSSSTSTVPLAALETQRMWYVLVDPLIYWKCSQLQAIQSAPLRKGIVYNSIWEHSYARYCSSYAEVANWNPQARNGQGDLGFAITPRSPRSSDSS